MQNWNRMIPVGGLNIYPEVWYWDANDIGREERSGVRDYLESDPVYSSLRAQSVEILKGDKIGRTFCVYVKRHEETVGVFTLTERLDNPHGYGQNDFLFTKYIFKGYQRTAYSRYASGDLIHIVFYSGLANNLYSYIPVKEGTEQKFYWDRVDQTLPCVSMKFLTDSPEVQKYILPKQEFQTKYGTYLLIEFNGGIYRKMDLTKYFLTAPGRKKEVADKWLEEMNDAAKEVWRVV